MNKKGWISLGLLSVMLLSAFVWMDAGEVSVRDTKIAGSSDVKGLAFVAPPRKIPSTTFDAFAEVKANWVQIIPYAFCRPGETFVNYNYPQQWWGESPEGAATQIDYAKEHGLKVLLKPHLWVWGQGWAGDFDFETNGEWELWEKEYTKYLMTFAKMAESKEVEMLCLGTEIRHSVRERPKFWKQLAKNIRKVYSGQLTYAANWDNYEQVDFWESVDFIGIDAYIPLSDAATPSVAELEDKWKPHARAIRNVSEKTGRKVLFTEYGYMSVDGAAGKNWELEANRNRLNVNLTAQANAYEALYRTFWDQPWFAGGFFWKWHENHASAGGPKSKRYTPQNKPASKTIAKWYGGQGYE